MEQRRIRVGIGVPSKGVIDDIAYVNHLTLFGHLGKLEAEGKYEFVSTLVPRMFPAIARERMAEYAIQNGCDYLFMYDDDMLMHKDIFEQLVKHDVDVVAPLAFTRLAPFRPVIYNLTKGYDAVEKKSYYMNLQVPNYPKDKLVEVDAVGFGAVLIKTSVLKAMKQPWFMTTSGAGEDIHFCHAVGEAGFHVFVDTATKIGHLGDRVIVDEPTYEKQQQEKPREIWGSEDKYTKQ